MTANPARSPEIVLRDLIEFGKVLQKKAVLYYSNDQHLRLISANRNQLQEYYEFLMPPTRLINSFLNKVEFSNIARRYALPIPYTYDIHSILGNRIGSNELSFPLFVKPETRLNWFDCQIIKELGAKPYKGFRVDNYDQLMRTINSFQENGIRFIVQQFIEGDEDRIFSFHGFLGEKSTPLGYFVGKKIRTYPTSAGRSTYLELVDQPELAEVSIDLLKRMEFVGPVKLDFKKDLRSGRFYLLEVNARFTLWSYLGAYSGVNLPEIAFHYFSGNSSLFNVQRGYSTDYRWLHFRGDYLAFKELRANGKITFREWIVSLLKKKVYEKFAWHDPWPFLMMIWISFRHRVFRVLKIRNKPTFHTRDGLLRLIKEPAS